MTKTVKIGRNPDNDVVIADGTASRHHCQITQDDNGNFQIEDLGSSNGTFVNGNKIYGSVTLSKSDVIRIGNSVLPWNSYFQGVSDLEATMFTTPPTTPTPTPVSPDGVVVNVNQVVNPTPASSPAPAPVYTPVPAPRNDKGCGFGVASFILGLLGVQLFAIIFAIVALSRGEKNKGFAIAGLILGIIWAIIAIIIIIAGM